MLNGPSDNPVQLVTDKEDRHHIHFVVPQLVSEKWRTPSKVLEDLFQKHGRMVATYPWVYIVFCFLFTFVSSFGLIAFRWENNIVRLWNPTESETGQNFAWLWKNHPPDLRRHSIIFHSENVLEPSSLMKMYNVRKMLYEAVTKENVTWSQACLKVPLVPTQYAEFLAPNNKKSKPDESDLFSGFGNDDYEEIKEVDLSVEYYPDPYCKVFNSLDDVCFEDSIFELFAQHGELTEMMISSQSQEDILDKVNNEELRSGIFSVPKDFQELLGGISYDASGRIIGAKAVKFSLYGKMNATEAHLESAQRDSVLGDQLALEQIDDVTRSIEDEFISILTKLKADKNESLRVDFIVAKSFPDAVNERITGDIPKVAGSFILMFIYVGLSLGKPNCVDNKSLLSLAGLASVLMALITSYGICSALGFFISPLHNFIPFLLLGLGVDDMFVIIQAFDLLEPLKAKADIPEKLAQTLRNSGVAITVTSITDFLAFAVGGTTTVPALHSFCIYCGLSILVVYVYQITWFAGWLVVDQRRMLSGRNACLPCSKVDSNKAAAKSGCSQKFGGWDLIGKYADFLTKTPAQVLIIGITLVVFAASLWGNYYIEEEFDPWLFLNPKSYPAQYKAQQDLLFPDKGESVLLFFSGNITKHNLASIDSLLSKITDDHHHLVEDVISWYIEFQSYYTTNLGRSEGLLSANASIEDIRSDLAQFLYSPNGGRFQYLFTFDHDLKCGKPLPSVYVTIMEIHHKLFNGSNQGIEAMNTIKQLMRSSGFDGKLFPFSPMYSVWEIDEIIRGELYRNVGLATLAITIATVCLLSDLVGSMFVIACVFITLTNVSGIIYFWGLNIDTVTCTVLIVCIGLSVDFSVHVVHSFLHSSGSSREIRMKSALKAIAPAVINGGFSTLLAVALLMFSDVYVFVAFFKIFCLVVFFGLFNGLVLLPVLLILIGPQSSSPRVEEEHLGANPDTMHELVEMKADIE